MKKIKTLILSLIMTFAFTITANAASGSINASTSARTVAVGSTFTVTVKVNCSEALGSWQFGISYDSAYISLQSGSNDTNIAEYGNGSMKTKTYTYKFKAIKAGSAGVRVSSPSMVTWNDVNTLFTPSSSGVTVNVKTQAEIEASYSKDNNLKSLTVEGYELTPAFNKDTTEYTVSVPDTVETIKVSAQVNDGTARVSGTGDINISEGINKVEVVVTAQNGSLKTYYITIDVKDLNPISVEVGGTTNTVVKKADLLTEPTGHTPTTIKIGDTDVPAFKSDLTNLTIVGLKDENGKVNMYSYNEETGEYTPYTEIKNTSVALLPVKTENEVEGFKKTTITINGDKYDAFQSETDDSFYLIFAMNVATGEEDYYIFDVDTNMFVKYNAKVFEKMNGENREFKLFTIALGGTTVVLFLLVAMVAGKNSKFKKIIKRLTNQLEENKSKDKYSIEEVISEDQEIIEEEATDEEENIQEEVEKELPTFDKKKRKRK